MTRKISVLGSTGSIGENTLDIINRSEPGEWEVVSLTAQKSVEKLADQAIKFGAKFVALADPSGAERLKARLKDYPVEIGIGDDAVIEAAKFQTDFTMSAITGAAGLEPTLAAIDQGIHVGLANKECLVCAGDLFMSRVIEKGATLLPVDSEHNAIFQVLESDKPKGVRRLILTASGGPFREVSYERLKSVSREDALAHPVWKMGAKISIDSATLMNKGLELIEASYLFNRPSEEIDVIIHPQSIIHSMVEYVDGSVLAQLGSPDMRTPIAYALGWPDRMCAPIERLDFKKIAALTFFEPNLEMFPALQLARDALEAGGRAPTVLNAANEVAVAAFLNNEITFLDISKAVSIVLEQLSGTRDFTLNCTSVSELLLTDEAARISAMNTIKNLSQ